MMTTTRKSDLRHGKRPKPSSGRVRPDPYDPIAQERAEIAEEMVKQVWVEYPAQRVILNSILRYVRSSSRRKLGEPLTARRLAQLSQAGKSAIITRLGREWREAEIAAGKEPNPHAIIHITIDKRTNLKQVLQDILSILGDGFLEQPTSHSLMHFGSSAELSEAALSRNSTKILSLRLKKWARMLDVKLIVIDEVQWLDRVGDDAVDVTKQLQAYLDQGVVPIVFVGNENSPALFEKDSMFAARCLAPLKLPPLSVKSDRDRFEFRKFCIAYDLQLTQLGAMPMSCGFLENNLLSPLMAACGGHIGRAARLLQVAVPAAMERGAVTIDAFDLYNATRDLAIPNKWVFTNPFSVCEASAMGIERDEDGAVASEART